MPDGLGSAPPTTRWTHIALPVADLGRSLAFYATFTPLVVLKRFQDDVGESAWLCEDRPSDRPFVLVLVSFSADAGRRQPILSPFAHLGIEVPTQADVDELAGRADDAGCLLSAPRWLPAPVGYVCALGDPDGNVVEISFDQGVYGAFAERFGTATS